MTSKRACIMLISILMGLSAFSQEIILMNSSTNNSTINLTDCSALLYDSGGPDGNYSNNENYRVTICVPGGYPMEINVTMNTEGYSFDDLYIYEGTVPSGSPIAGGIGGSSYTNQYTLNSSCATFVWHSDGSVCSYRGFEIEISCQICQDYTLSIVSDAQYDENDSVYFGCSGANFTAQVDFPNNNEAYEQTIENTTFSWHVLGNNRMHSYEGLGLNEISDSLAPGAYTISLTTIDANHCMVVAEDVSVNISVPPSFAGTTASSDVPLGTEVSLTGVVNPIDAEMPVVYNFDQICLADITSLEWSICLYATGFTPGQTIQSADDIESIGMQIEHSYMGDLDIILQCPNGQSMTLLQQTCGGGYLGEPVDLDNYGVNSSCDGSQWVGVGYDYFWTERDNNGLMSENCPGYSIPLPAGNYQPVDSFSNLIGCPLNGEWRINVRDHLGSDDGIVFQTELHFSDNITPAPSFQNTYGNEMWWEGEGLQDEGLGASNIAVPTTVGQVEYTFSATDNYGCTYDTTLTVIVREFPCQDYAVSIVTDAQYNETDGVYLGCPGTTVSAQIYTPNNNENYEQTVENITFLWRVYSNNNLREFEGLGMSELPVPLETGIYLISLTTIDSNGCQIALEDIQVYISVPPTFTGTTVTHSVYLGDTVELNGIVVPADEWQIDMSTVSVNNERFCFNNGENANVEQSSCFDFVGFAPNLTITSADDIQSVGVNMNHSYTNDLDVYLQCPDGRRVSLFSQSCGGAYFGEPTDLDEPYPCDDGWVGIGYDYYWTEGENNGLMSENCQANCIPLPSGNYNPVGNFSELIGCPINGEWCIVFVNHHFASYGTVFRTELNFADNIRPTISFQNTYGNEMWWEGEGLQDEGLGASNIAVPTTVGQVEYTFSATDNFGCTYDTTLYVNVLPVSGIDEISDDDILVFPNPVNDMLTITSSETISEIEIVNDKGQVVSRMDVNGKTATCNVSELASGVYVVKIRSFESSMGLVSEPQVAEIQRKFIKE